MRTIHLSLNLYPAPKLLEPQFWAVCGRKSGRGTLVKQTCAAQEAQESGICAVISACYQLSEVPRIPFYSTSNGYNYIYLFPL